MLVIPVCAHTVVGGQPQGIDRLDVWCVCVCTQRDGEETYITVTTTTTTTRLSPPSLPKGKHVLDTDCYLYPSAIYSPHLCDARRRWKLWHYPPPSDGYGLTVTPVNACLKSWDFLGGVFVFLVYRFMGRLRVMVSKS